MEGAFELGLVSRSASHLQALSASILGCESARALNGLGLRARRTFENRELAPSFWLRIQQCSLPVFHQKTLMAVAAGRLAGQVRQRRCCDLGLGLVALGMLLGLRVLALRGSSACHGLDNLMVLEHQPSPAFAYQFAAARIPTISRKRTSCTNLHKLTFCGASEQLKAITARAFCFTGGHLWPPNHADPESATFCDTYSFRSATQSPKPETSPIPRPSGVSSEGRSLAIKN